KHKHREMRGLLTDIVSIANEKGKKDEKNEVDRALVLEILNDIKINLTKIHEHGTRADSIVKSMLMHSRGGSGKMESTDLNALVKEYVNLAFHGMRAGKHPIDVDIDMKLEDSVGKVPLIAEDFSRVIMNLSFNAFDAMREKKERGKEGKSEGEIGGSKKAQSAQSSTQFSKQNEKNGSYRPKLTVRTSRDKNSVSIDIQDNGPGIPDEIKDKVLQPFFTTKKGTQGTGLGLSITNDIIKAHGGSLQIDSSGDGTTMKIILS
ncbi:MAG TPA: hypothetical protein DCE78_00315, partial [Bacteroidetes bacterium]|nr:hypothetical protein [Bacteroidota bacterium]